MHIASTLSLPHGHRHHHAPVRQVQNAADASSAPAVAPATQAPPVEARDRYDGPRRSPLYQALVGALSGMAQATPATPTEAAASTEEGSSSREPAPDLDSAVMDFAHALMQAMRGRGRTHEHHEHHHAHHDHGRRAWGEPSQRIDQLGSQIAAAVPVAPDASTEPVAVDGIAAETASTAAVEAPAAATPAAAAVEPTRQSRLLDAFGTLSTALGLPAATNAAALRSQLSSFLQTLAQHLRANAPTPLRTGALLDVTA